MGDKMLNLPVPRDEDGRPIAGQVVKVYREHKIYRDPKTGKLKHWTQEDLAKALNVTTDMVKRMENKNQGLDSFERRILLCKLLNIPPAYLGLVTLEELNKLFPKKQQTEKEPSPVTTGLLQPNKERLHSIDTYRELLQTYHELYQTVWTVSPTLKEIEAIIVSLHKGIRNITNTREKTDFLSILWHYHILAARCYASDKRSITYANFHIDKALTIATTELQNNNLIAETYQVLFRLHKIHNNNSLAKDSITAAIHHLQGASSFVQCNVFSNAAQVYQTAAIDEDDTRIARKYLKQSQTLLENGVSREDIVLPVTYNDLFCKQGNFHVLLSMKQIVDAEDIIDDMERTTSQKYVRRHAIYALDRAKCYIVLEDYERAVMMLLDSLQVFKTMGIHHYIAEIKKLCQQIKKGNYGDHPDIAELEIALSECYAKKL
jgi:transcriptional regulator with XRE-family HTH domain